MLHYQQKLNINWYYSIYNIIVFYFFITFYSLSASFLSVVKENKQLLIDYIIENRAILIGLATTTSGNFALTKIKSVNNTLLKAKEWRNSFFLKFQSYRPLLMSLLSTGFVFCVLDKDNPKKTKSINITISYSYQDIN